MLTLTQHASSGYKPRTLHNAASATLTVAFALDFNTAGERLTKKAAMSAGTHRYVAIPLNTDPLEASRMVYRAMLDLIRCELVHDRIMVLNIAGNGIYSLSEHGWTQDRVNQYVYQVLTKVNEHLNIHRIVSGGQTGADIAGLVAAVAMGVDAVGTLPKGFLQRGIDGVDREYDESVIRKQILDGARNLPGQLYCVNQNE